MPYSRGMPDFAVVDVETSGLSFDRGDRVVEIAVIRTDFHGRPRSSYTTLLNPERSVGPVYVHGIKQEYVEDAPYFGDVAGDILEHLKGAIIVAHNAWFDYKFIRSEFSEAGMILPNIPRLCTLQLARKFLPTLPSKKLSSCCDHFDIKLGLAHSAFDDALATSILLTELLDIAKTKKVGFENLGVKDLEGLWDRVPEKKPSKQYSLRPDYRHKIQAKQRQIRAAEKRRKLKAQTKERRADSSIRFTDSLILSAADNRRIRKGKRYFKALDSALKARKVSQNDVALLEAALKADGLERDEVPKLHNKYLSLLVSEVPKRKRLKEGELKALDDIRKLLSISREDFEYILEG